jgi:hypothetical protein
MYRFMVVYGRFSFWFPRTGPGIVCIMMFLGETRRVKNAVLQASVVSLRYTVGCPQ